MSRAYVYENHSRDDGALLMSIQHEWLAPGVAPTSTDPENRGYPYERAPGDRDRR